MTDAFDPVSLDAVSAVARLDGTEVLRCPCCDKTMSGADIRRLAADARRLEQQHRADGAVPAASTPTGAGLLIDPHAHMISRTTDDYEAMARSGVVAVIEPSFWLGQPRTSLGTYVDYFATITGFERFRAGQFGIRHYCTIGLNPKEANDEALAEAVLALLPRYLAKEGVVAIGELGYDEQTPAEERAFRTQLELAREFELPVLIHTPHRDKRRGTLRTMDVLREHGIDPRTVVIDHNNEETVDDVVARGYWCAFSVYPGTKMGNARLAAIVARCGPEQLIVDSACDWGVSDPLAVAKTARVLTDRGVSPEAVRRVTYDNALAVYGLNGEMQEAHWLAPAPVDQRTTYSGNSVLRGGQQPRIDAVDRRAEQILIN